MAGSVRVGDMAFVPGRNEGVGAIRRVHVHDIVVYVENAGDFEIPLAAVTGVHDGKVMLDPAKLPKLLLDSIGHVHDREDPSVAG